MMRLAPLIIILFFVLIAALLYSLFFSESGIKERNMIVKSFHKKIGEFKSAGNPIKMSTYKDEKTRGDIPDLDEHRDKILKEFS